MSNELYDAIYRIICSVDLDLSISRHSILFAINYFKFCFNLYVFPDLVSATTTESDNLRSKLPF